MDAKIGTDGDLVVDESGRLCCVSGKEELYQRMYLRLAAVRGGFLYDKSFGSDIGTIDLTKEDAVLMIEAMARRALAEIRDAEVTGAVIEEQAVTVFVSCQGDEFAIEIKRRDVNE